MAIWTGSLSDFAAGEEPTAVKMQTQVDALHGLTDAETSWTPTMKFGATAWSPGNATIDATYRRSGKAVDLNLRYIIGTTTSFNAGTGVLSVAGLPAAARRASYNFPAGQAFITDASATTDYPCICYVASDGSLQLLRNDVASGGVGDTTPFTWTGLDSLRISVRYEAA